MKIKSNYKVNVTSRAGRPNLKLGYRKIFKEVSRPQDRFRCKIKIACQEWNCMICRVLTSITNEQFLIIKLPCHDQNTATLDYREPLFVSIPVFLGTPDLRRSDHFPSSKFLRTTGNKHIIKNKSALL